MEVGPRWVVRVRPGYEIRYSNKYGSGAECPTYLSTRYHRGRKIQEQRAAVSGYVFVDGDPSDPYVWHYAAGIDGFARFIAGAPLRDCDLDPLREALTEKPANQRPRLRPGQRVQITNGPFAGTIGTCIWSNKNFTNISLTTPLQTLSGNLSIRTDHCAPIAKQEDGACADRGKQPSNTRRGRRRPYRFKRA